MIEHPDITRTLRTGYPCKEPKNIGFDSLGNEIYAGDVIYELFDKNFVADELGFEGQMILKQLGASRRVING